MRQLTAALGALALLAAGPAIETVGGQKMAIALPAGAPIAAAILVPGGTTLETIHGDGSPSTGANFVMRIRPQLLRAGVAIGYVENPGDLRAAIARMRTIKRPLYLIGTSNGSVIALKNAALLGADGPDGLVLTSTVTEYAPPIRMSVSDIDVSAIAVPIFFLHNANDACRASPPSGLEPLTVRLKAARDIKAAFVVSSASGYPATNRTGLQCSPQSPHGYMGIDDEAAAHITDWIRAQAAANSNK